MLAHGQFVTAFNGCGHFTSKVADGVTKGSGCIQVCCHSYLHTVQETHSTLQCDYSSHMYKMAFSSLQHSNITELKFYQESVLWQVFSFFASYTCELCNGLCSKGWYIWWQWVSYNRMLTCVRIYTQLGRSQWSAEGVCLYLVVILQWHNARCMLWTTWK